MWNNKNKHDKLLFCVGCLIFLIDWITWLQEICKENQVQDKRVNGKLESLIIKNTMTNKPGIVLTYSENRKLTIGFIFITSGLCLECSPNSSTRLSRSNFHSFFKCQFQHHFFHKYLLTTETKLLFSFLCVHFYFISSVSFESVILLPLQWEPLECPGLFTIYPQDLSL